MKKYIHFIPAGLVALFITGWIITSPGSTSAGNVEPISEELQVNSTVPAPEALEKEGEAFSRWLKGGLNRNIVPAAAAGIVKGERLVFSTGAFADKKTIFGIASLSKTFTAILALRLAEEGILSLDEKASTYLRSLKIARKDLKSKKVTLRHLLTHTSGLPTFGRKYRTFNFGKESVHIPEQTNPAGYCYAYSNPGFVLAKLIIESASGKSYEENLKKYIFGPLEMHSTTGRWSNGTGGIQTNLEDLSKYAAMLIGRGRYRGRKILSRDSFEEMLSSPLDRPETRADYHYSLSWEVITVEGSVDSYYKAGRWYGEASAVQVFPRKGIALIYVANPPVHLSKPFMSWRSGLTARLRSLVRTAEADRRICSTWPFLDQDELKRYTGTYRSIETGRNITISFQNRNLYSNIFGEPQPLYVFSSNRLLLGKSQKLHSFVWQDNRIIGLSLTGGFYELVR